MHTQDENQETRPELFEASPEVTSPRLIDWKPNTASTMTNCYYTSFRKKNSNGLQKWHLHVHGKQRVKRRNSRRRGKTEREGAGSENKTRVWISWAKTNLWLVPGKQTASGTDFLALLRLGSPTRTVDLVFLKARRDLAIAPAPTRGYWKCRLFPSLSLPFFSPVIRVYGSVGRGGKDPRRLS